MLQIDALNSPPPTNPSIVNWYWLRKKKWNHSPSTRILGQKKVTSHSSLDSFFFLSAWRSFALSFSAFITIAKARIWFDKRNIRQALAVYALSAELQIMFPYFREVSPFSVKRRKKNLCIYLNLGNKGKLFI